MKLRNFPSCRCFAPLATGVIFTMAALSQTIHAQTTWSGTGTAWSTATWSAGVPNSTTATILTGAVTLNVNTAAAAASVNLANTAGTLTLNINDGQSLAVTGAITDTGAGTASVQVDNTTSGNAATVLSATSIAAASLSLGNPTASATFFSFGNNITVATQLALGSSTAANAGSTTYTQTGGTVTATNNIFGVSIGQALSVSSPTGTHTYNLSDGTLIAGRIGVLNGNGNNSTVDRYAMNGTLNFNNGTIQSTNNGTLTFQNGYAYGAYNGTGTKDMQYDTSKPLNVVLASTGTHTFNADGATGDIRVSPSAQITGSGTLAKTGLGALTFTGGGPVALSTWSGDSTVTAGNLVTNYSVIGGRAATGGSDTLSGAYSAAAKLILNGGGFTLTGRGSASASSATGVSLPAGTATSATSVTVTSTTGLVVGQAVTHANLPVGTYIRRILNSTLIELSAMSTSTSIQASQTLNFGAASFANSQTIDEVALTSSAAITVNPGSGTSTTLLSFGNVSGTGALTKLGTGKLSLTGSLTYTGNTAVSAGTMDFAPVSGTSTLTGNITGSGAITKSGNGTTIFAGGASGNTVTGTLAVNGGTLQIGSSTTFNDKTQRLNVISSVSVAAGATLVLNNSAALADGNAPITLAGTLIGDTTGIVIGDTPGIDMDGFHNRLGALTMNGGTLTTYNGGSLVFQAYALKGDVTVGGSSASTISAGGTIDYIGYNGIHLANNAAGVTRTFVVADATSSSAADLIVSARLLDSSNNAGASALTKSGAGTMVLSGDNSYTGDTLVNAGILSLGNGTTNTSLADTAGVVISADSTAVLNLNYTGTDTVASLTINGEAKAPGVYDSSDPSGRITGTGTLTVGAVGDVTPPTLASSDIVDDKSGAPVLVGTLVTYTVTFNEDMDAATVSDADFGNAGTAAVTIGSVTETSPSSGVFTVQATPSSTGTLVLQVNADAVLKDAAGNDLNTTSAIADDTSLNVITPFESWSGGAAFTTDTNSDGVNNGLAWLLGAADPNVSALSLLPTPTVSGGNLTLSTFNRVNPKGSAKLFVEYSNDLSTWTSTETATDNGVYPTGNITITIAGTSPQTISVTVSAAASAAGKLFARLRASEN